ncbi:Hypothetical protein PHPALM_3174 [Phytophthora palmivora]|uniref:ZSWIM1/3 RNaseH-like domain-containing protein n=1 Tax=Phytophthora palmivora TaxID=4796 RepID=A0A2P4YN20_9STRA|nr:Hypothetical protein PHPALM_3174 [Phytophthora palmivora]
MAALSVNDSPGLVNAVCFQTAGQKRLFKAFPEVIMVATTHGTNQDYYKLFSILVDGVFGKGQYVQHSLVESEQQENLVFCLNEFKESNPAWENIRVVITNMNFHEKDVLAKPFPDATQLLCQFHVIDYLRRQMHVGSWCKCVSKAKREIITTLQLMMKADSPGVIQLTVSISSKKPAAVDYLNEIDKEQANRWVGNDCRSAKRMDAFALNFRKLSELVSDRRQMSSS